MDNHTMETLFSRQKIEISSSGIFHDKKSYADSSVVYNNIPPVMRSIGITYSLMKKSVCWVCYSLDNLSIKLTVGNLGFAVFFLAVIMPGVVTYYLIYPIFRLVFGTLYPAYASYKAVRTKNVKEYVKWMMYWIVFALFTCAETFTDVFFSFWFPFYYEIKIILVLWLLSPATKGSSILYRRFVHPALIRREAEIDDALARATEQGYTAVLHLGTKGVNYATTVLMQTAIKTFPNSLNALLAVDQTDSAISSLASSKSSQPGETKLEKNQASLNQLRKNIVTESMELDYTVDLDDEEEQTSEDESSSSDGDPDFKLEDEDSLTYEKFKMQAEILKKSRRTSKRNVATQSTCKTTYSRNYDAEFSDDTDLMY